MRIEEHGHPMSVVPAGTTAGVKIKFLGPWAFLHWIGLGRRIRVQLLWWRRMVIRDRLKFQKQLDPRQKRNVVRYYGRCHDWHDI